MPRPISRKKKKVTAEMFTAGEYKLSLSNWLAGGDPLIPKSRTCTKSADTTATALQNQADQAIASESMSGGRGDETDIETFTVSDSDDPFALSHSGESALEIESDSSDESDSDSSVREISCRKYIKSNIKNIKAPEKVRGNGRRKPIVCLKGRDGKIKCLKEVRRIDFIYDSDSTTSSTSSSPKKKTRKSRNSKKKIKKEANSSPLLGDVSDNTGTQDASTPKNTAVEDSDATNTGTGGAESNDGNQWTASQDAIVLSMREGGEPWADIGKAVGCEEEDVRKRWEALTASKSTSRSGSATAAAAAAVDTDELATITTTTTVSDEENERSSEVEGRQTRLTGRKGKRKRARKRRNKKGTEESEEATGALNGEARPRPSYEGYLGSIAGPLSMLYDNGGAVRIEPAVGFSPMDCKILGLVDSKHKVDRWLELQSGFFNATGRMVSLDVLKHKMGECGGN